MTDKIIKQTVYASMTKGLGQWAMKSDGVDVDSKTYRDMINHGWIVRKTFFVTETEDESGRKKSYIDCVPE